MLFEIVVFKIKMDRYRSEKKNPFLTFYLYSCIDDLTEAREIIKHTFFTEDT